MAAKSPSEAIGKPASMMSTPKPSSFRARRTFSSRFIEQPGDCSPSRKVVSKIFKRSVFTQPQSPKGWMVATISGKSQSYNFYDNIIFCDSIRLFVSSDNHPRESREMDINQLEVFLAVAQERSFSRAAEALHRTQPAVSQAIRRLET